MNILGAPVHANSSHASAAIATNGGGTIYAEKGMTAVGGIDPAAITYGSGASLQGFQPPLADPLASLPQPDPTTYTPRTVPNNLKNVTLQPGIYTGGMSLTNGDNVTLAPGNYYFKNGGITTNNGSTISTPSNGAGVSIYNDPGSNSDGISISGAVDLFAPTSGTYQGVLFFQSRTSAYQPDISVTGSPGSTFNLKGTFYAPKATVKLAGNGAGDIRAQFISYNMVITGGAGLNIKWDPTVLPPIRYYGLVE